MYSSSACSWRIEPYGRVHLPIVAMLIHKACETKSVPDDKLVSVLRFMIRFGLTGQRHGVKEGFEDELLRP
jgi:hypothetical protein